MRVEKDKLSNTIKNHSLLYSTWIVLPLIKLSKCLRFRNSGSTSYQTGVTRSDDQDLINT